MRLDIGIPDLQHLQVSLASNTPPGTPLCTRVATIPSESQDDCGGLYNANCKGPLRHGRSGNPLGLLAGGAAAKS